MRAMEWRTKGFQSEALDNVVTQCRYFRTPRTVKELHHGAICDSSQMSEINEERKKVGGNRGGEREIQRERMKERTLNKHRG